MGKFSLTSGDILTDYLLVEHLGYETFERPNLTPSSSSVENKTDAKVTLLTQIRALCCCSWQNLLLIVAPLGFALNYNHASEIANFWMNFLAMAKG
jgi:hypothetical protein